MMVSCSVQEEQRLSALRSYRILDTRPESQYDQIVFLARAICQTPVAAIGFLDLDRQWFKAKIGTEMSSSPRLQSFCHHAVQGRELLEVPDASLDFRFAHNPFVTGGPKVRFYAGQPIITRDGHAIGTLCVIDFKPRHLTEEQRETLKVLADKIVLELELSKLAREATSNAKAYSDLVENLQEIVFKTDEKGRWIFLNQAWTDITGNSLEKTLGKRYLDFIHPDEYEATAAKFKAIVDYEVDSYRHEGRYLTRDGYHWFQASVHMLRDDAGNLIGTTGTLQDITDRKLLEEQKETLASSSKMAALGEMAAGMAHEINNPLCIIKGLAEHLMDSEEDEITHAKVKNLSSRIDINVDRITRIIESLRIFARDGEQDPLIETPVHTILSNTLELCSHHFKHRGVELIMPQNLTADVTVACRPGQILQVLINLLNNSLDAVSNLEERWVKIEFQKSKESVAISVTDSGSGIQKTVAEKIMLPFFTTKEVGKGTGLGLSVSKGIIESHGGTLHLDTESKNTKFLILLPAPTDAAA